MARLNVQGLDEFEEALHQLDAMAGDVALDMVTAGGEVMVAEWKEAAGAHVRTGALQASIAASKAKKEDEGASVEVSPQGTDSRGVRNAEKAFILNYGSSHITGDHWVDNAVKSGEPKVTEAMRAVFNAKLKGE